VFVIAATKPRDAREISAQGQQRNAWRMDRRPSVYLTPEGELGKSKHYAITLSLGGDVHTIEATQETVH
jgi:hypothetical protein